jgi:hypothetical protein
MPCLICSRNKTDRCHIKSRGSGGTDDEWNLVTMCRVCHSIQHSLGWFRFAQKHPVVMQELIHKGWTFEDRFGFPKLVRKPVS